MDPAIQETAEGVVLSIHVQPRASRTAYAGRHGEALKFRVAAPPVEGAANEALCRFLATMFGVSKGAVRVESGLKGREKRVVIAGLRPEQVVAALEESA